jgi:hypothetical protein
MSGITDSRKGLGAALEAKGLRVAYDPGLVTPPGVLVVPETPWVGASKLASRSAALRWRTVVVAGRVDSTATLEDLEDLVGQVIAAVHYLDGWSTPAFDAPGTVELAGANYLAAIGRVDHLTEV